MPDTPGGDLSLQPMADPGVTPPTMLDANVAHYEAIYKKCQEAAGRIVSPEGLTTVPALYYRRRDKITESLFKRFCDDQAESAKTRQMMGGIETLLGMLSGVRR